MQKIYKKSIPVSLVVPVYNGGKIIISQIEKCEKILKDFTSRYEILIADDKSQDNTKELLKKNFSKRKNFRLIFNENNLGIARNIHKLYKLAKLEYVCLFSADGGWQPQDIKKLVLYAANNGSDIVIGQRERKNYSTYRKTVSFFYNFLPVVFFGISTMDAGSIKLINRKLISKIPIISTSVFFEAELIIRAKRNGAKISSVPVYFKRLSKNKSLSGKLPLLISSLRDLIVLRVKI